MAKTVAEGLGRLYSFASRHAPPRGARSGRHAKLELPPRPAPRPTSPRQGRGLWALRCFWRTAAREHHVFRPFEECPNIAERDRGLPSFLVALEPSFVAFVSKHVVEGQVDQLMGGGMNESPHSPNSIARESRLHASIGIQRRGLC